MVLSLPHSFVFSYLPASIKVLLIIEALKEGGWVLKAYLWPSYMHGYCVSVAYIVHPHHPYIECLSTNSLIHSGLHSTLPSMH